jgi:hypothetical protein
MFLKSMHGNCLYEIRHTADQLGLKSKSPAPIMTPTEATTGDPRQLPRRAP